MMELDSILVCFRAVNLDMRLTYELPMIENEERDVLFSEDPSRRVTFHYTLHDPHESRQSDPKENEEERSQDRNRTNLQEYTRRQNRKCRSERAPDAKYGCTQVYPEVEVVVLHHVCRKSKADPEEDDVQESQGQGPYPEEVEVLRVVGEGHSEVNEAHNE